MGSYLDTLSSFFQKQLLPKVQQTIAPAVQGAGSFLDHISQSLGHLPQQAQNFYQQNVTPALQRVANQPLLSPPGLGMMMPHLPGPTLGQAVKAVLPNFNQSTIGTALKGNFSAVPQALSSDIARASKALNPNTREGVNTLIGGMVGGPAGSTFKKQQLDLVRTGFDSEVRNLIGQFSQIVERNPNAGRKELGQLGEYIQGVAETVFGKDAANLSNKQLKNAFDAVMQEASKGKGIIGPFSAGLATKDIRQGAEPLGNNAALSDTQKIFENLDQWYLRTYRKGIGDLGASMFGGIKGGEAQQIASKIGEDNLKKLSILSQASKDIKVRRDARHVFHALSDRVYDGFRIDKLSGILANLESKGTPEGDVIREALQGVIEPPNKPPGLGIGSGTANGGAAVAPPKQVSMLQQFGNRARNVIESQGPGGKELGAMLRQARDTAEITAGKWTWKLPTVRGLSKEDFANFVDVAEGKAAPLSNQVAKAAAEWGGVREEIYQAARQFTQDGKPLMDIGHIENYFPRRYDQSLFTDKNKYNQALKHLVESGQARTTEEAIQLLSKVQQTTRNRRFGNLELARQADLPGYDKTKDALFGYIEGAAKRIGQAKTFGPKDEKALYRIGQVAKQGGDAKTVKSLFDTSVGAKNYGELQQKVSRVLRGYQSVTKLGLGAITNTGQSINTATVTGTRRTVSDGLKILASKGTNKQASDFALKAGVTLDGVLGDLKEGSGFAGKVLGNIGAPGFNKVEKFNRTLAAWSGKGYAEDLAKQATQGSQDAARALQTMGLDVNAIVGRGGVLNEAEQIQAARNIVERTQFKVDAQDLPGWSSSPWGKVLTQFKSFAYNQSAFIGREIVQPALKGNVKPLLRFLLLSLPVGGAISETKNFLRNRPSEEDPKKRALQYFQQAGGLGLGSDVVTGLFPQNGKYLPADRAVTLALGTIGGPTVGTAADAYGSLSQAVQGKPISLGRFALRQTPLVGSTLSNTLLPYKPGGRSGSGGKTAKGGGGGLAAAAGLLKNQSIPTSGIRAGSGSIGRLGKRMPKISVASLGKLGKTANIAKGFKLPKAKNSAIASLRITTKKPASSKQAIRSLSQADIVRITKSLKKRTA